MTILTRNPSNTNPLQPNKFTLNFSRLPNMQYFCQTVSVPGISMSEAGPQTNPFVDLYKPGEKAIYDLLNVTFTIDEELKAWKEIHDWIRGMTFPEDFKEYRDLAKLTRQVTINVPKKPQYSDASITIFSSSFSPMFRFNFYDCFPTSLSTFVLSAADSPENTLTADAIFRFAYYDIDKIS